MQKNFCKKPKIVWIHNVLKITKIVYIHESYYFFLSCYYRNNKAFLKTWGALSVNWKKCYVVSKKFVTQVTIVLFKIKSMLNYILK